MSKRIGIAVLILVVVVLSGMFVGQFFGWFRGKKLGHGYHLVCFEESGNYYIERRGDPNSPGGVLDGVIERIGTTNQTVLCLVKRLAECDTNGWYVLNTRSGQVTGPVLETELPKLTGLTTNQCVAPEDY